MLQQEDGSSDEELGDTTCLGMKGLIEEGKKALKEDMEPEVMDAALETATKNPAAYLGVLSRRGTVEVGKEAALILLDKNPLEDIRNTRSILGVISGNDYYDRPALDQLLQQAKAGSN